MKTKPFLLLALTALLAAPVVRATDLYWDVDGTTPGFSTVVGSWNTGLFWNTDATGGAGGSLTGTTTSAHDLIISQATVNTGSITVTGTQNASSITFAPNVGPTTNITGGTAIIGGSGSSSGIFQQSTGANTIATGLTLKSDITAFNFSNSSTGLLTIGAVTGAATSGTQTITVGSSAAGNITLNGIIGNGAGGGRVALNINSSGAGITTLSGASTFTGGVTMTAGTASFTSTGLGSASAANKITFAGNSTLQWGAATTTDLSARLIINTGVTATLDTGANNVTFGSVFGLENNSKGTLNKTGSGILTLGNTVNQFAGNTVISNGRVALGGQFSMWQSAYDTTGSTGAIGLNVTGQAAPWLGGLAGSVNLATGITGYSAVTALTLNPQSGSSVSYGGVISNGSGSMTLDKTGHGTQTLTGANSYSGATTVWAGTLALSGASGTALNSAFTVRGGTLELDNSTNLVASRLTDATALSLGSLTLKGRNTSGVQGETVGATTFAVGGKVTIINGTAGGDRTTLALGAVTRSGGAAIDFVGTNGTLGGAGDTPNVTTTGTFPGGSNGILPWATVNGTTWAGTASANSIVAYAGAFVDPTSAASNAADNAQLTGTGSIATAKNFNSLNVITSGSGESLNLASGANLNLTSGGILKSGTDAYTISSGGGILGAGAGAGTELIAHVNGGALTISAPLDTDINSIAKGGTGDLILSGTRKADFNGNTSIAGGQLEFRGGGFTISGVVTGAGGLTVNLNAGQTLNLNNNSNSYAGPTIVKGGYLSSSGYTNEGIPGGRNQTPNTNPSLIMSNLILQGGIWYSRYTTNKDLGAGPGQVQVLAGTSGFVHDANSGGAYGLVLDGGRELVWGSTYFQPDVFVHSTLGNLTLNLANGFDLAGSTRTVLVGDATYNALAGGGSSQLGGVIRTSSGTAGLTKTGVGILLLTGANTFNGAVTVSQGTLAFQGNANVASPNPLGQSSAAAANLLLANGTTLLYNGAAASTDRSFTINGTAAGHGASLNASGSAAINFTNTASPDYGTTAQTRILTLTGTNTGNNILAANLADNGGAAVSVTKTGAGLWVLSNASNSYTGPTTLNAGTLSVGVAGNLGAAASDLVFNGGTLQVTGTGLTNFASLGRTVVFNPGQTVGMDINNAGNVFTVDQTLNQTTGGLNKSGAGTLVINSAHTYTGQTTVTAGTLRLDDGGVISAAPLSLNGGTFAMNRSGTTTLGTDIPALIAGAGSLANVGAGTLVLNAPTYHTGTTTATAGTIQLSHALAIQNSALVTTGAGTVTLSGVTTPTFGGLSGATGNLASVISSGYGGVTALTLNPQAGSVTYGGVIANNAANLSLTKTGAGTQILQNSNTYAGETTIKEGTLTLSGAAGSLASTTINLNGGTLTLDNSSGTGNSGARVSDAATVTVNASSALNFTHNAAAATDYAETIGTLSLQSGSLTYTGSQANATGPRTSNLFFNTLSHSGTATVNFAGTGLGANARNTIKFGAGVTDATDLGPWAIVNGADFASYSTANGIVAAASTAVDVSSDSATTNWRWDNNRVITASLNPSYKTLFTNSSGAARSLDPNGNTVSVGGLSTTGNSHQIIGTGALQTLAAGDPLYIHVGANSLAINPVIQNFGGGATASALVKSGGGQLTLSGTNTYSGGTVLNGGTLATTADTQLGNTSGGITVNGTATWNMGAAVLVTYNRSLAVNDGAVLSLASGNNGKTVTGVLSGNGTLSNTATTGFDFSNTGNTFTGTVNPGYAMSFRNLGDSSNPINSGSFTWTGGAKTLALRPFTLNASGTSTLNNNGTGALSIQQPLAITGAAGARALNLGGTNTTSTNQFAGNITDGPGSVVSLTKATGSNIWALSGANTYTGATTLSYVDDNGILIFQGMQALSPNTSLNQNQGGNNQRAGTIRFLDDSATPASRSTVNLNFSNTEGVGTGDLRHWMRVFVGNNSTGNLGTSASTQTDSTIQLGNFNLTEGNTGSTGGGLWVSGANGYRLQIANVSVTLQGSTAGNHAATLRADNPMTVTGTVRQANDATAGSNTTLALEGSATGSLISGNILDSAGGRQMSVSKAGTGIWTLSGGGNTYTGVTTVSGGVLRLDHANALPGGIGTTGGTSALTFSGGVIGLGAGDFTRNLATAGTVTGVNFTGAGGWAAYGADRVVNLNNDSHPIVWATANTGLNGQTLILGAASATHTIDFQNPIDLGTATRTVQVDNGTASVDAKMSGLLSGGVNGSLTKTGQGTLQLTAANTFTGTTTVSAGTLVLTGASGTLASTARVAVSAGATLQIHNTSGSDNLADRLNNAATVALTSGILNFSHTGAAGTNYSETTGPVTISGTGNRIISSRAATGQTSTLTLGTMAATLTGLTFEGASLGDPDQRNRILISSRLTAGAITGAFHLDTLTGLSNPAIYSLTNGVGPLSSDANVFVDGGIIPNGSSAVSIVPLGPSPGVDITLSSDPTVIESLNQTASQLGTVSMPGQTLRSNSVLLGSINSPLTLGTSPGSGTLTPKTANGTLSLNNNYAGPLLTVNAVIADNGSGSSLAKSGLGTVVITAGATYTGTTAIAAGSLTLTGAGSLPDDSAVNLAGSTAVLHLSGISASGETIGPLSGVAGSSVVLDGKNLALNFGAAAAFAGVISGSGSSLAVLSGANQTLTGDNTFTGNVTIGTNAILTVDKIQTSGAQPLGQGSTPIEFQGNSNQGSTLVYASANPGETNRGLSLTGAHTGGTVNVTSGTLTVNGALSGDSKFYKAGAGTLRMTASDAWSGNGSVDGGTLVVGGLSSAGSNSITGGNWDVAASATLRINTTGSLETPTLTRNGTFDLEAGTLRTNTIDGSGAFVWGAGTITPLNNLTEGLVDRTDIAGSPSGPVVREGNILDFNGNLATSSGSILDLGGLFTDNGLRYNQIKVTGSLALAATDALRITINPYLLRPTTADSVFTGDWGTLRLVVADTFDANDPNNVFDSITGITSDNIGWRLFTPGLNGDPLFGGSGSLPLNSYYIEYVSTGITGVGIQEGAGGILFHYRVAGSVPEPGSAGLLMGAALLLRVLRRRAEGVSQPLRQPGERRRLRRRRHVAG